jgi:hypothetical protein
LHSPCCSVSFQRHLLVHAPRRLSTSPPLHLNLTTPRGWAEWRWQSAQTVFEGKVEDIQLLGWPLKPEPGKTVRTEIGVLVSFSNVRFYRGQSHGQVQVETGLGGGDCGYPFKVGQSYVVEADTIASGRMITGICDATNLLESSGAAVRFLRGDPPAPEDLAAIPNEHSLREREQPILGKICGKVSFPPGAKPQTVELRVWPMGADERSFLGADGRYTAVAIKESDDPDSITFLSSSVNLDIKSKVDGVRLDSVLAF